MDNSSEHNILTHSLDSENISDSSRIDPNEYITQLSQKYPVSLSGKQCIGPCYKPGSVFFHPSTATESGPYITPVCPTRKYVYKDPYSPGKGHTINVLDACSRPTVNSVTDIANTDTFSIPYMDFSGENFVKFYYGIKSFDDMLDWLEKNKSMPYRNKERIFDKGMFAYGTNINIIDHRFVQHIKYVFEHNLPLIYKYTRKYIHYKDNNITLSDRTNYRSDNKKDEDTHETIKHIRQYIKNQFLSYDELHKFINKFIRYYKSETRSGYVTEKLVRLVIEYIIKRILTTIKK